MKKNDAYRALAGRHGYQDSKRYRRILEYLMTPRRAELVALLPAKPDDLADKLGIAVAEVRKELEDCTGRA